MPSRGSEVNMTMPTDLRLYRAVLLALFLSWSAFGQTYTVSTVAGNGDSGASPDNVTAISAAMNPGCIAVDAAGNLYIADDNRVREVSGGIMTTVAGNGSYGFSGDGGPATEAQLLNPHGLAVDAAGNLYIADTMNLRIRKVSKGIITTVAGDGTYGFGGDGGPATEAQLDLPYGIAVDAAGNLYIADEGNNRVRKVSGGIMTTVAGTGADGFSGDGGPATAAQLNWPRAVAVDAAGNLYIADTESNRIREVSNGVITTVAGNGTRDFGGDNGPATAAPLNWPDGISLDAAGNLYIADTFNSRVREVSKGVITTVGGNGVLGYTGDNGPAESAELSPDGVAVDAHGTLFVSDTDSHRIRALTPTPPAGRAGTK
jgi:trimeric autotransporter adhesin